MRPRADQRIKAAVLGVALLAGLLCDGAAWAKGPKRGGPGLWIVADRIVGFVPFTIYLYGKVLGTEPGQVELCRSEVAWVTDLSPRSISAGPSTPIDTRRTADLEPPACDAGDVVRTPDGYDYTHDMRFVRPGTYQVRLMMVDRTGHRMVSNTVQVNAF
ncbi:MAG TPA: hypothetical protein VFT43_04895 [Candidatus Polarisedimenticolia bacterium]|nr:hypothetical protein [Candidatus Polarisedimenticolia bacterium]